AGVGAQRAARQRHRRPHRETAEEDRSGPAGQADSHGARRGVHPAGRRAMIWSRPRSIRLNLTVWYVGAMVVVLGVYAACLLIVVDQGASRALDNRLRGDFHWAA